MPWSPYDRHLSERDAHTLCHHVVEALRRLHANPTSIGVDLQDEGFWFTAVLNGRPVHIRTGQGTFTYDAIAKEMVLLANEKTDRGLEVWKIEYPKEQVS